MVYYTIPAAPALSPCAKTATCDSQVSCQDLSLTTVTHNGKSIRPGDVLYFIYSKYLVYSNSAWRWPYAAPARVLVPLPPCRPCAVLVHLLTTYCIFARICYKPCAILVPLPTLLLLPLNIFYFAHYALLAALLLLPPPLAPEQRPRRRAWVLYYTVLYHTTTHSEVGASRQVGRDTLYILILIPILLYYTAGGARRVQREAFQGGLATGTTRSQGPAPALSLHQYKLRWATRGAPLLQP